MHAILAKNVDGSVERRRRGRDKDREASVVNLFDDECWDKSVLNLSKSGLPRFLMTVADVPAASNTTRRPTRAG